METSELLSLMQDRMLAYSFLARAYHTAPDATFIQALRAAGTDNNSSDEPLATFFRELSTSDDESIRIDLAADYNRLFLGMGPHPVAPYESVYTSEEGLLMQDARDEVVAAYQTEGLDAPEGFGLPEDHMALELDFMAQMSKRSVAAVESGDDGETKRTLAVQEAFLRDHLSRWSETFCNEIQTRACTSFFRGIALMTKEQIENDRLLLTEI